MLITDDISLFILYSRREIPSSNIALHSAHCARNLQKCEHCGDMVPRKLMDEHYDENHDPVSFQTPSFSQIHCLESPNRFHSQFIIIILLKLSVTLRSTEACITVQLFLFLSSDLTLKKL